MVSEEEAAVASLVRGLLETSVCVLLVRRKLKGLLCAAEAYAERGFAGVGGWWLLPDSHLEPECCQLALVAHTPISSQSCEISGLLSRLYVGWRLWRNPYLWMALCKTLAMHDPAILNSAFVSVRQRCDNKSFVCVASKGMSTLWRQCFGCSSAFI